MEILLANPRGFCAGVERAIDTVEMVINCFPKNTIYVYHEIVHNQHIIQKFKKRGVKFIENVQDAKPGSVLIFSAHGVSKQIEELATERNLITIDATCPLVSKIHREAQLYAREGYKILVIGNRSHPEIIGTIGRIKAPIYILEKPEDVNALGDLTGKIAYVTQSTLSCDHVNSMVQKVKEKFPDVIGRSDVCYATQNRQDAVKALAQQVDLVIIIGSQNSSNSKNLMTVAQQICGRAFLIDSHEEIKQEWFEGVSKVGISSGASAPDELVIQLIAYLKSTFGCTNHAELQIKNENVKFKLPVIPV